MEKGSEEKWEERTKADISEPGDLLGEAVVEKGRPSFLGAVEDRDLSKRNYQSAIHNGAEGESRKRSELTDTRNRKRFASVANGPTRASAMAATEASPASHTSEGDSQMNA